MATVRDGVAAAADAASTHDAMVAAQQAQTGRIAGEHADWWGAIAERFRADPRREMDLFLEKLAGYLQPDSVFVDVGGGAGRNSLPMANRCREVINVDPSAGMGRHFRELAEEAGITNARFVEADWLGAEAQGDVLLAAHVTYFVPRIVSFIEKLVSSARRRVIIAVLTVPPPNQPAESFRLVHGEDRALVPGPDELLPVLEEMGITPEVIEIGPANARRPLPRSREEAIQNELTQLMVGQEERERAAEVLLGGFDTLFVETPKGFARRTGQDARELMITWDTSARNRLGR